jgi:hypothetical protein
LREIKHDSVGDRWPPRWHAATWPWHRIEGYIRSWAEAASADRGDAMDDGTAGRDIPRGLQ